MMTTNERRRSPGRLLAAVHVGALGVALTLLAACGGGSDDEVSSTSESAPITTTTPAAVDPPSDTAGPPSTGGPANPLDQTVTYCSPGGVDLAADLYRPDGPGPHPVVLYVHGGGWTSGSRSTGAYLRPTVPRFLERGIAVVSIDYRLAPEVTLAEQLDDVSCAVSFLRDEGPALGLDPERMAAMGASSGGHLVSLLATSDVDGSDDVLAVVDLFGPADLDELRAVGRRTDRIVSTALGVETGAPTDLGPRFSPVDQVSPGAPPFLIVHGDADDTVPIAQSEALAAALEQAGVPVELLVVGGGPHGLDDPAQSPPPDAVAARVVDYLAAALSV
jgi:acetyl esterase/lipase